MVRLKDIFFVLEKRDFDKFQFLNGAIKSFIPEWHSASNPSFQFLNGAIKRYNSKTIYLTGDKFQFLNGAIKSIFASLAKGAEKVISIPKWCD